MKKELVNTVLTEKLVTRVSWKSVSFLTESVRGLLEDQAKNSLYNVNVKCDIDSSQNNKKFMLLPCYYLFHFIVPLKKIDTSE